MTLAKAKAKPFGSQALSLCIGGAELRCALRRW